jgi:hypothetical protein
MKISGYFEFEEKRVDPHAPQNEPSGVAPESELLFLLYFHFFDGLGTYSCWGG